MFRPFSADLSNNFFGFSVVTAAETEIFQVGKSVGSST